MPVPYVDTPRTDADDRTHLGDFTHAGITELSFEPSFASPSKRDDILKIARGGRVGAVLSTPSARNPLAQLRNPNAKNEFTPLLKSATRHRAQQQYTSGANGNTPGLFDGRLRTPAVLKAGYKWDSPGLPEPSEMVNSSSMIDGDNLENTPIPPEQSSSTMSTPLALPRKDGALDGGNVLTLREQEAVCGRAHVLGIDSTLTYLIRSALSKSIRRILA